MVGFHQFASLRQVASVYIQYMLVNWCLMDMCRISFKHLRFVLAILAPDICMVQLSDYCMHMHAMGVVCAAECLIYEPELQA